MRLTPCKFLAAIGTLVAVLAMALWIEVSTTASQRERLADTKRTTEQLADLRLQRDRLAAQIPSQLDRTSWRSDENELEQVREEVARLRQQMEVAQRQSHAPALSETPPVDAAFETWNHAGQATPAATLQTVLWSIVRGDVDTLAGLIGFDGAATDEAHAFFASLPEDLKSEYETPEGLLAAVMVGKTSVTYESATIVDEEYSSPNDVEARVQLGLPNNRRTSLKLRFQRGPAGWKLLVPPLIVDGYRHRVLGTLMETAPQPLDR